MRRHYGSQRELLPLHELRIDERLQLATFVYFWWSCGFTHKPEVRQHKAEVETP
jgi:hypothetical protein